MAVILANPKQSIRLDQARVASIKLEDNAYLGTYWCDVYVVYGRDVGETWEQYVDPETGAVAQYYRIAPGCNPHARPADAGMNPESSGEALGKCGVCGAWQMAASGACSVDGCLGAVQPYDGFERLCERTATKDKAFHAWKTAIYEFLTTEEAPDPVTGEMRVLLAAE